MQVIDSEHVCIITKEPERTNGIRGQPVWEPHIQTTDEDKESLSKKED